ncbi:nucleotidyltransferase family protein [Octadecabacter sp. SW4]|uniref:nucleotidyltransferase family protein n=1 Tax=Octadecabacter sp. SW4 TaxID=2602067 RepID=UPI0011C1D8BD|nr:nucleotidyltransferase family protein [Octadecabacter sp. SW4]QEE35548.1 nucleotidyltransferase family protein [Octadecabacter sp. SW4]
MILILAAGASTRMGHDKLLLDIDGQPMLRRMVDIAAGVAPVLVTLPPRPHARYGALSGAPCILVPVPDKGFAASLRHGVAALPEHADSVLILPADMPDVSAEDMRAVIKASTDHPEYHIWRATTAGGKPGHPVMFDASMFDLFGALYGEAGGAEIIRNYPALTYDVPLNDDRARRDIDTPEDWQDWLKNR